MWFRLRKMEMSKLFNNKALKVEILCGIIIYTAVYIYNIPPTYPVTCFDCEQPLEAVWKLTND